MLAWVSQGCTGKLGAPTCKKAFRIGIQTLAAVHPAVLPLEVGALPDNAASDEFIEAIQVMINKAGLVYSIKSPCAT